MNLKIQILALSALGLWLALPAKADVVNVYQIGSTSNVCGANTAYDPNGACLHGTATPTWTNTFSGTLGGGATLTILAEGIDNGSATSNPVEVDQVLVNGTPVGDLTQQNFYIPIYNLSNSNAGTGPLDLDGDGTDPCVTAPTSEPCPTQVTDLSLSTFNVTGLVVPGANTIEVVVDPSNFVDEIDVSTLTATPEPGTLLLFGTGLFLLGFVALRRRRQNTLSRLAV